MLLGSLSEKRQVPGIPKIERGDVGKFSQASGSRWHSLSFIFAQHRHIPSRPPALVVYISHDFWPARFLCMSNHTQ